MSYILKIIGKNVKKRRLACGFSMEKLAEMIGISYQNLSKIENGRGFFKVDTFEKLCEALNLMPEELVSFDGALIQDVDEIDDVKLLLKQIINNLDTKNAKALYKLTLAFLEAIK